MPYPCGAPSSGAGGESVEAHNNDLNAHGGIKYDVSELFEIAGRVSSVYTTSFSLPKTGEAFIPWNHITYESVPCKHGIDQTKFISPLNELYDIELVFQPLGINVKSGTFLKVSLINNGNSILSKTIDPNGSQDTAYRIKLDDVNIIKDQALQVKVEIIGGELISGALTPFLTYLAVNLSGGNGNAHLIAHSYRAAFGGLNISPGALFVVHGDGISDPTARVGKYNFTVTDI